MKSSVLVVLLRKIEPNMNQFKYQFSQKKIRHSFISTEIESGKSGLPNYHVVVQNSKKSNPKLPLVV